ncbi:DUF6968 family protein [Methylobacterium marchantiae]|uniref:DUF6968 family protein n=1 Tax=Methylobacterium marchantiae TaxID=600331 RepID=A0ABW3X4L7_9HYPH|nr:hypothetical protein AIGOOFII_2879 [Methylobacterium marchantiae]
MSIDTLDDGNEARHSLVERRFSLHPGKEVTASFFRPEAAGKRLWRCRYILAWPDRRFAFHAYGEDGVQALLLAMELVHRTLLAEAAYLKDVSPPENQADALAWMGRRDLGLPMPGTVKTEGLHASLIQEAQDDGGDLDLVILRECTGTFLKVARIAGAVLNAIGVRCRSTRIFGEMGSDEPDPVLDAVLSRIGALVICGRLEAQGDLSEPRYSEVRRPAE